MGLDGVLAFLNATRFVGINPKDFYHGVHDEGDGFVWIHPYPPASSLIVATPFAYMDEWHFTYTHHFTD